ncbi:hypothetical protein A1C_00140 [Rickettsia akari str. Hartford]|uniref:Uncharacterized protein n=1 Tax=Rickettsia akari (strain Hartford) TaxID=293614 RepID=A8GLT8_RICAH|nr:hypothetical protein A1C_00140 [Rickettsia akari str. Hartford]
MLILETVYWLGLVAVQILQPNFVLVAAVDLMRQLELEVHLVVVVTVQLELVLAALLNQLNVDCLLFVRIVLSTDVISQSQLVLLHILPLITE